MADNTFNIVGNLLLKVDGAEAGLNKLKNSLSQLKIPANLDSSLKKSFSNLDGLFAKYKAQLKDGFNTKGDVTTFTKTGKQIEAEYDRISATISKLTGKEISFKTDLTAIHNAEKELEKLISQKEKLIENTKSGLGLGTLFDDIRKISGGSRTHAYNKSNILETSLRHGDLEKAKVDVNELINALNNMSETKRKALEDKTGMSMAQVIDKIKSSVDSADVSLNKYNSDIKKTSDEAANLKSDQFERANQAISDAANSADKLTSGFKEINGGAQQAADSMLSMTKQVEQLQQSTQYFFSLRNMINLLKRGIDDAVQSVKELDKAMTETAVVTDYKVSDLWGMLPEYTKVANELGATTQGAYETMTLYYQQGLDQQQAFELGAETMKMARIAGLDYAETTDMMTAALRGFNMELNEVSAKRVNDVYSELAAITASDTEELGTAMQRTASIAASAGASFEGTTAFLAQAIETTREPAENIGTAMKTIVARFQELKKNPLEISEVDGEEVDYNKIDAALKTIGVDLKDTNGQFRNFDEVMLDISARWDSLSQAQQRYIATTAAGSRQQSRFIAMVSNYDRTMQLMEAANNSAGASDEQFGKTMDSLESKLNQLHNAWQAFTMGIANNGMIKLAVDGLTNFLTVTNTIIDKLSLGSGVIKSFLSVFAAFTGLKAAGRIANRAIGGLGGLIDPQSTFKEGFKGGAIRQGQNQAQAKAISTPIVNSLSKISGQIAAIAKAQGVKNAGQKGQSTAGTKETSKEDYKQIKQAFDKLSSKDGFKMGDASNLFKQLDEKHQYSMFKNSPGTKAAMKQASLNWIDSKGWSEEFTKEGKNYVDSIYKGMEQGKIPVSKGISLIGQPAAWGKVFGTDVAKNISSSYIDGLKTSTNQAHQEAIKYLVPNPEQAGVGSDYFKQWFASARDEQKKAYLDKFRTEKEKLDGGLGGATGTVSNMGRFANDIGAVADRFTQAGYGISAFGSLLSQLGGPIGTVGAGIQSLGGIVSSVGMSISGATGLITMFTEGVEIAGAGITIMGSTIAAVVGPIAVLGAALFIAHQHFKKIKEAGEEVTNTFKETNKTVEDNIAKLKSYQSEFATLSKGVDSNGNNVSLDDSQYQRYLEIVDDIATINPEIVQGYNAQGYAIIDNNKALAETLKKQEEIKKSVFDTYTNEESLQKLINARNINKDYKNIQTQENGVSMGYGHGSEGRNASNGIGKSVPLAGDVSSIADKLRLLKGTDALGNTIKIDDKMLQKYGIESMDALISGEEQAVKKFIKHRDQIQADIANSGIELNEGVLKGFEKLGEDSDAFNAAIQPVYDNLLANVSNSKVFESIAPEFRNALNIGLKDLASQDLSASEMSKAANNMAARFANLTTSSGKYKDALDIVEKAQDNFAATLNETEYRAEVQPAIDDLIRLKEEALKEDTAYGDALAEYLENQIERISRFTEEGSISLVEALNTATNEIAAAEGAYNSFKEATKSDFSTGAESMKSIFDEITKETDGIVLHMQGKGDKTFWAGAESLFGADALVDKTPEQVKKMFDRIEPMLQDGQAGFDAFWTDVFSNENIKKLQDIEGVEIDPENWMLNWDDNVNPDVFHEMAQALGMSDEFLTSMLNKGRQFGAIDFMDTNDVRKALSTDTAAVKGTSTTTVDGQKVTDMFVKGDYIKSALADAGMVTPQDQQEAIDRLATQGVHIIKDPDQISSNDLKDMGISDMKSLIQTLGDTGQYTKDEIEAYAEKLGDYTPEDFADGYQQYLDSQEHPEIESIQSINSTVQQIASILASQRIEEGHLDNTQASSDFKRSVYGEAGVRDTKAQAFAVGRNEQGNVMTAEQYKINLADLQNAAVEAQKYIDVLSSGMENASGQDLENMKAEKASMEATLSYLQDQISQGQQVWAEKYAQQQYDLAYQSAIDAGENVKTAREEADTVKENALKQAQELIQATQDGLTDGLNSTNTSGVKAAAKDSAQKYTDTSTGNTSNMTSSTITKGVEFVAKGAEEITKNIDEVDSKASEGATHTTEFKTSGEKEAKGAIKKMTDTGTGTKTVKVGASVDTSGAQKAASTIGNMSAKIGVGIKDNASSAAEKIKQTIDKKKATIDVGIRQTGNRTVNITVKKNGSTIGTTNDSVATGKNNKITHYTLPSLGSLAKGSRYGRLGPNGRGGLTLTGEKGFEIAWLPSESRSMILGAQGPQMINLPSDAVVYTHEQSKDILKKRQTINAGSHSGKATYTPNTTISTSASTQVKNNKDTHSAEIKKAAAEVVKITQKAGKVLVWWENAAHRMKAAQHNAEINQKTLEKLLKNFGTTGDMYRKAGEDYITNLKQQQQIANEKQIQATNELEITDKGKAGVDTKKVNIARDKLNKAKATYNKKKTKKNKEALDKAQKDYNKKANAELTAIGARREISYEVTEKKKTKGKWKTSKKTKKTNVNLGKYITIDPETGAYQIDQTEINKVANGYRDSKGKWHKGNKSKAEAIKQAAESQLNDLINKQNEAEKEAIDAASAITEFYDTTYETFDQWEKTITEAYLLGQQIEKLGNIRSIFNAVEDLELSKLEAGLSNVTNSLPKINQALEQNKNLMIAEVKAHSELIDAKYAEYKAATDLTAYQTKYESNNQSTSAAFDYDAITTALNFLKELNFDSFNFNYSDAVNALNANNITEEAYNKIKEGLDKIAEKQNDYYNAITNTYNSLTEIYQTIEEYQSYIADFEESLIKGYEEQTNREIDKLNKLNTSLTNAAKDLIDEVRRKLDERRKQEDNRKTEQDITQKQQRLAALRADTSGGHQVEIAQLEKELAEAQQNYGRTLEDQLLDKLSNQQDEAAKQRERQIKLLEAQRDLAMALGTNVEEINGWLMSPQQNKELIRAAWLENQGYNDAGKNTRKQLEEEFEKQWTKYLAIAGTENEEGALKSLVTAVTGQFDNINLDNKEILTPVEQINNKLDGISTSLSNLVTKATTNLSAEDLHKEGYSIAKARTYGFSDNQLKAAGYDALDFHIAGYSMQEVMDLFGWTKEKNHDDLIRAGYASEVLKNELISAEDLKKATDILNSTGRTYDQYAAKGLVDWANTIINIDKIQKGQLSTFSLDNLMKLRKYKFATGGLATQTGPAWLDGTPSKPELVLNPRDTQNLIALKDILAKVMNGTNDTSNTYGDIKYEININVDKIEKDYDVDRVVEKVKKEITKGAGYRNVTQVRNFR